MTDEPRFVDAVREGRDDSEAGRVVAHVLTVFEGHRHFPKDAIDPP